MRGLYFRQQGASHFVSEFWDTGSPRLGEIYNG